MNLVNELQVSAEKDNVLTVLRKTKRLASKLDRQDIAEWLQAEQGGYSQGQSVPNYRKIGTTLAYKTDGYIPAGYGMLQTGIGDLPDFGLTVPISVRGSISAIISWIKSLDDGREIYNTVEEGSDYCKALRSHIRFDPLFERQITFLVHLNSSQIRAIPEQIKDSNRSACW